MTTKEDMIQKALYLFSKEGYENIGVQSIVDQLGFTKPTLYHHFGSKAGLLRSILDQYALPFQKQLEAETVYNQDIILSIEKLVLFYLQYAKRFPIFYSLSKNLHYSPRESESYTIMVPYYTGEVERIKQLFENISKHHTGLIGKSEMLTYTFLGHLDAYITYHLQLDRMDQMTDEEGRKLAKQFLYGVFA
ncbi:MAG: TetR/AcrR family transcriptional regulator [Vallitaleaceae bacterium]|nr:TetR/AcrR family transcriptional regulator [Vallitaleaceae bacterium]